MGYPGTFTHGAKTLTGVGLFCVGSKESSLDCSGFYNPNLSFLESSKHCQPDDKKPAWRGEKTVVAFKQTS